MLMFITPAYKRYALSMLCFKQRWWAIQKLSEYGIEANCVVIADDVNLKLAEAMGFDTVEAPNDRLGRKFNDGYEHAHRVGADFVCPIGSDSWIDPQFIIEGWRYLEAGRILCSRNYQIVHKSGWKRVQLWIPVKNGVTYVMPIGLLESCNYRPVEEGRQSGCDNSTWTSTRQGGRTAFVEAHDLDTVAFQSKDVQITNYELIKRRWGVGETNGDVFTDLSAVYPSDLVEAARRMYA